MIFKRLSSKRPASSIRMSIKSRMPRRSLKRFPRPTPCSRTSRSVRVTTPCGRAIPLPVHRRLRPMAEAMPAAPVTVTPLTAVSPSGAPGASPVVARRPTTPRVAPTWLSISSSTPRRPRAVPTRPFATPALTLADTVVDRAPFRQSMPTPVRAAVVAAISMSTCPSCLVRARSRRFVLSAAVPARSLPTRAPIAVAAAVPA